MRFLLALVLMSACVTPSAGGPPDVPAVIVHPTAESRAALGEAVTIALNGAKVTLADYALTGSSQLVIERMVRRDAEGNPVQGRVIEEAERFRLVKSGADCVLVHERSGRRYRLIDTECAPELQ